MLNILRKKFPLTLLLLFCMLAAAAQHQQDTTDKRFRPVLHFTPPAHWMNDPNGMLFHKGIYHLFYQYYPDSNVWGPMHWGHATSRDLMHWKHQPIALYPDSLGMIFSGSAVLDIHNTSGLGTTANPPLVAIFTQHNETERVKGSKTFQNQSIAYSLDNGLSWKKYSGNPVLKNPGIPDFRDPKVSWYAPEKKWVMTLAVQDRVHFYASPDLIHWEQLSEFGKDNGAHGGVWECPDLFPLTYNGKTYWVLLVSINPGGPNKGSATQYFIGDFDGRTFRPSHTDPRWIDYGPDSYAGVSWSNTGDRRIFMGWMSNWMYAQQVPTTAWRSAMTLPRDLSIREANGKLLLASDISRYTNQVFGSGYEWKTFRADTLRRIYYPYVPFSAPLMIQLSAAEQDLKILFTNKNGDTLVAGYNHQSGQYYINRTRAGISQFHPDFAAVASAPRFSKDEVISITLMLDRSSLELVADNGLTVLTALVFPHQPYTDAWIQGNGGTIYKLQYAPLKRK